MSRFDYIIERIKKAEFNDTPFKHIFLTDLFLPEDFTEIVDSPEINIDAATNDNDLFEKLFTAGYKIVEFPGCTTDKKAYINWREGKGIATKINTSCEGFGITLRLYDARTPIISELNEFLLSDELNSVLAEKFEVPLNMCHADSGIQKYLDGYEISPHPDIRRKALTFMININPHKNSEEVLHHTQYLQFRPDRQFVQEFWEGNPDTERCWVPWGWCDTVKYQTQNNSIVIFSPSCNTLHGVKADYDHLPAQRTQLYGNLWYSDAPFRRSREWEEFDGAKPRTSVRKMAVGMLPAGLRRTLRNARSALKSSDLGSRNL